MQLKISREATSIAPMSCTVFLSHILVCLEGELGEAVWPQIQRRIPSRFGRVDYWLKGLLPTEPKTFYDPQETTLETGVEACDWLILVGYPEDILARQELAKSSCVMTLIITVAPKKEYLRFKKTWGSPRSVFLGLPPGEEAAKMVGLCLDSLVGLFNYYEDGLARFNLYDLRHIWPDQADLSVEYRQSKFNPADKPGSRLVKQDYRPWNQAILGSDLRGPELKSLLVVVRTAEKPAPEALEKVIALAGDGRTGRDGVHWYAVADCPLPPEHQESVLFICGVPN